MSAIEISDMLLIDDETEFDHIKVPELEEITGKGWSLTNDPLPPIQRGYHTGLQTLPDWKRNSWVLRKGRAIWMSASPAEREAFEISRLHCKGTVLVLGLGLGVYLYNLIKNPEVTKVHVVELDPEVIAINLSASNIFDLPESEKIVLHQGDALNWHPPEGEVIDHIAADFWPIWADKSMESDMQTICKNVPCKVASWWSMEMSFAFWAADSSGVRVHELTDDHWKQWGEELGIPIPDFPGVTKFALRAASNALQW